MSEFKNISPTNGFDVNDLNNARQNNYAWSMSELDEFIYVGTGRNIPFNIINAFSQSIQIPMLIKPEPVDDLAEIWRYKKDGSLGWQRVYKAPLGSNITGFRFMIRYSPFDGYPCLYAASYGQQVQVLKTTNGVDWFITNENMLKGTSSRAMLVHNGKLYVATIDEASSDEIPLLYSSKDPEFYPWEAVVDPSSKDFDISKNPNDGITNMTVFNNKIYVATSNTDGVQVWRTDGEEPELNKWTLIVDKGFGDSDNKYSLSIGVFKDYLYVSGTKELPLAWIIPRGCDIIRIDEYDNWRLVVGGKPFKPSIPSKGVRGESLSGYGSGFDNPFNVYAWQIQEYKDKLLISTFDDSSNMELILDTMLLNRAALEERMGAIEAKILIEIFEAIVRLLNKLNYPIGFDLYVSEDGINFKPMLLRGLHDHNNYGGRMLYVDSCDELYLGTANPFQGCEVWKVKDVDFSKINSKKKMNNKILMQIKEKIDENYAVLYESMPIILSFLEEE